MAATSGIARIIEGRPTGKSMMEFSEAEKSRFLEICDKTSAGWTVGIVSWLDEVEYQWDEYDMMDVASHGQLDMAKRLRENGCRWNHWVVIHAIRGGHLELVKWLRADGCPWPRYSMRYAHDEEVIEWLREEEFSE